MPLVTRPTECRRCEEIITDITYQFRIIPQTPPLCQQKFQYTIYKKRVALKQKNNPLLSHLKKLKDRPTDHQIK